MSNLLEKASIITTPTAYSEGKLHSVKPVQYFGSELVTNGTFDTDSDWTLGTGITISNGKANFTGNANTFLTQSGVVSSGKTYKATFTVSNYVSGAIDINLGGSTRRGNISANGTYIFYITVTSGNILYFQEDFSNGFVGSIDNVSVKEVIDADFDFTRGSSATRENSSGNIESVAANLPRIDYTGGTGSLLLEPQSTNLFPYSEDFTQWALGTNSTLTFESNVIAPDGSLGVYRLQNPQTGSTFLSGGFRNCRNFSLFVKAVTEGVNNQFNLDASGQPTDTKTATTKWQRFDRDFGTQSNYNSSINNGIDNYASDIYIWGAQAEALSYATSYIPTNGSTVTRLADVCNNAGSSDLINSTEGVLYAEMAKADVTATEGGVRISRDTSNEIRLNFATGNRLNVFVNDGGSAQVYMDNTSYNLADYHKIAIKYKLNDYAVYVDGTEIHTDTNATVPTGLDKFNFYQFYGNVKALAVFKEALSNDQLEGLTGEGYETFNLLAQANNYTII